MSLGSWRTFERLPRDDGLAIMTAAREVGINFLDDARYDDELGTAPLATGYSEVVFGELFRAADWDRDQVVVANKLWWEHWPSEDAAAELDGSLERMHLDHVDLIYAIRPPDSLSIATVVEEVSGLIASERARSWGTGMWSASQLHEALDICDATGAPRPVAAQMANSLVDHSVADAPEMRWALERGPIGLVASYVLAGGTLTGKYADGGVGRSAADDSPLMHRGKDLGTRVLALAKEWAVPPAHIAFAQAFGHPQLASIVFGASSAEQLLENTGAWDTFGALDNAQLQQIHDLGRT